MLDPWRRPQACSRCPAGTQTHAQPACHRPIVGVPKTTQTSLRKGQGHAMTDGSYGPNLRIASRGNPQDPYVLFKDIFGEEPPPGRIPGRAPSTPTSMAPNGPLAGVTTPTAGLANNGMHANIAPSPAGGQHASPAMAAPQPSPRQASSPSLISHARRLSRDDYSSMATGAPNSYVPRNPSPGMAGVPPQNQSPIQHPDPGSVTSLPVRSVSSLSLNTDGGGSGSGRSMWSGIKQRSASATGFHKTRARSDQRAVSLSSSQSTTRGGRAIPHRSSEMFGVGHPDDGAYNGNVSQSSTLNDGSSTLGSAFAGDAPTRKASCSTISSLSTLARSTIVTTSRKEPLVYPAMLSLVAAKFRDRVPTGDRIKNELTYKNSFTGSDAVDVIAYIIKTPDRNLALLLGRALDAQKFFHDVTYDNRLRDSPNEVYQFGSVPGQGAGSTAVAAAAVGSSAPTTAPTSPDAGASNLSSESTGVNGVFTLLADCYSPTCTRDKLCYSIACPRRLEQQARLNMKLDPGLQNPDSRLSLQGQEDKKHTLWINSVPPEVVESVPKEEQKRQEVICELIYTERDFVKDLEYLRDFWIKPLRRTAIIPEPRREKFIRTVFLNVLEVHHVNMKFAEALTKRQQQSHVVEQIADIVLEHAPKFEPFIRYGAAQLYGKYEFERERAVNPAFAKFVEETERLPESRKLELNGYLAKPTTRLARYPLLLDAILKHTAQDNPDYVNIPTARALIREFLTKLNIESGKTENRFQLIQLNQALMFRPGEYIDLKLTDEKRALVYKGELQKRPGEGDLVVYLFDNALMFVKIKMAQKREMLKVNAKPIPLTLLRFSEGEEMPRSRKGSAMIRATVTRSDQSKIFPITFQHLGRRGYELTLYASTYMARKTWIDQLVRQQEIQRKETDVYTQHILLNDFFRVNMRVNCAKPFDGGRKILYGTDQGVFVSDITFRGEDNSEPRASTPVMAVQMPNITQVDVLDKYGTLLFLADKVIYALPLEVVEESPDAAANAKRAKHIAGQATFYKVDECMGRTLLSVVKSHSLSAQIRVLEPADPSRSAARRPPLRRLLTAGQQQGEGFKLFKPAVDVPSAILSMSYLRTHLCLGCSRGFELLDLNTMKIESLLDPADTSLDFVIRKDSLRPISIYRIGKEFLLNYSDFSFFINSNGWRSRPDWIIQWESVPQHIVLSYPYLVTFEQSFIEIRNMNTELLRVITGENIRFLHESTHEILYVQENERGFDEVVSINFWEKEKRAEQIRAQ